MKRAGLIVVWIVLGTVATMAQKVEVVDSVRLAREKLFKQAVAYMNDEYFDLAIRDLNTCLVLLDKEQKKDKETIALTQICLANIWSTKDVEKARRDMYQVKYKMNIRDLNQFAADVCKELDLKELEIEYLKRANKSKLEYK